MHHTELLNYLIQKHRFESYLEIGCQNKENNFDLIEIKNKFCVDPSPESNADFKGTSDEYFAGPAEMFYDIIFIDGLHHADQVKHDIENSLLRLMDYGIIVVHDCNPLTEIMQKVPRETKEWTGDVWRAWVELRTTRKDLTMQVVDTDYGCGLISFGAQELIKVIKPNMNYKNFEKNKATWLNLISVEDFLKTTVE